MNRYQKQEEAQRYHEKHQTFTTFPKIVKRLLLRGDLVPISTADEDVTIWSALSDEQFLDLLNRIPLGNIYLKDIHADTPVLLDIFDTCSIDAERIMPEGFRFYALKYIPFIKEQMHIHDYSPHGKSEISSSLHRAEERRNHRACRL